MLTDLPALKRLFLNGEQAEDYFVESCTYPSLQVLHIVHASWNRAVRKVGINLTTFSFSGYPDVKNHNFLMLLGCLSCAAPMLQTIAFDFTMDGPTVNLPLEGWNQASRRPFPQLKEFRFSVVTLFHFWSPRYSIVRPTFTATAHGPAKALGYDHQVHRHEG